VRPWACLWVVLHREARLALNAYTGNGIIVKMFVCDHYILVCFCFCSINSKTMVLRGDFALTRFNIKYGVVDATVTVEHFIG